MLWTSCSTSSQRCSIGLRSVDCAGYLTKLMSCSWNQLKMMRVLFHGTSSCWKYPWEKEIWQCFSMMSYSNDAKCILKDLMCAKNIFPTPLHHQSAPFTWRIMDLCYPLQILNPTEWMSQQVLRYCMSEQVKFFQSSVIQFWWSRVHCSLNFLFLTGRSGTLNALLLV